jgi:hypothetical protein
MKSNLAVPSLFIMKTAKKLQIITTIINVPVRFFNAAVNHFNKDAGIVRELNHQLLVLLHLSKGVFIHSMSVVEEEVILRCQLNSHILDMIILISLYSINSLKITRTKILTLMASSVPTS